MSNMTWSLYVSRSIENTRSERLCILLLLQFWVKIEILPIIGDLRSECTSVQADLKSTMLVKDNPSIKQWFQL